MAMALAMRLVLIFSALLMIANAIREFDRLHLQVYGFSQGDRFKDEIASTSKGISAIRIYHDWAVSGIQIGYAFGEWGTRRGLPSAMVTEVTFGYPDEALVQIKGAYGPTNDGEQGITKLTFVTYNYLVRKTATYGPFGGHYKMNQTVFQSPRTKVKQITGFYGFTNSGPGLAALSYYYEPSK